MKNETLKYIRNLSKQDRKTLTQKCLKIAEETGELSKAILPFENAAGTNHRFTYKDQILEEVVDILLTAVSVAMSLDFTDEDLSNMIDRKVAKWGELQGRERKAQYPLPYEIHITIKEANQQKFRDVCAALDVKPIILALQAKDTIITDTMTSSKHYGDNRSAHDEMERITTGLRRAGFEVIREKIETVPWHPAAPSSEDINAKMPEGSYFETHIGVHIRSPQEMARLRSVVPHADAHLSQNTFKVNDDRGDVHMVTLRVYDGTYESFKGRRDYLREILKNNGFTWESVVTEFSLYDSKESHDSSWLKE